MFNFDVLLAKQLWSAARDNNLSKQERGDLLEILAGYILMTQGRFITSRKVICIDGEIDLLARNMATADPLIQELGTYLLVECKNWTRKVNSQTVKSFVANLKSASCHSGILYSQKGVTGVKTNRSGMYTIRKFYHRDNIIVIVFNEIDISDLVDGRVSLSYLLLRKYEQIRFETA